MSKKEKFINFATVTNVILLFLLQIAVAAFFVIGAGKSSSVTNVVYSLKNSFINWKLLFTLKQMPFRLFLSLFYNAISPFVWAILFVVLSIIFVKDFIIAVKAISESKGKDKENGRVLLLKNISYYAYKITANFVLYVFLLQLLFGYTIREEVFILLIVSAVIFVLSEILISFFLKQNADEIIYKTLSKSVTFTLFFAAGAILFQPFAVNLLETIVYDDFSFSKIVAIVQNVLYIVVFGFFIKALKREWDAEEETILKIFMILTVVLLILSCVTEVVFANDGAEFSIELLANWFNNYAREVYLPLTLFAISMFVIKRYKAPPQVYKKKENPPLITPVSGEGAE